MIDSSTMSSKLFLAMLLCLSLPAQSTDASVTGTISDRSGGSIPSVAVSAVNTKTGVISTTRTNSSGVYLFAALEPGSYKLTAEHQGFQQYVVDSLDLEVGAQLAINMALTIGKTTDAVEVKATAEQLETSTSTVGTVIGGQRLLDLPLVGRNAYDLIGTQAGTSGANGQNFNGTRSGALNITLDGVNVRENFDNRLATSRNALSISVDRIQEFRIITSPADAEYGRGAGQIQAISRGGTNQFHGSLFEENRNTSLTANTWFNNQRGTDPNTGEALSPRNFLIRNQYGGRVGGPVRRNKTFFHFDYEGSRQVSKNSATSIVYAAPLRQGIFRYFPGVRNGNAGTQNSAVSFDGSPIPPTGATGPLQSISLFGRDPNRLGADTSGIIAKELALMPLPNNYLAGDGLNTAGYTFRRRTPINSYNWDMRLDHHFTPNHRASFSYGHQAYTSVNALAVQAYPSVPGGQQNGQSDIFSLSFTSVLGPNLLNEFRAGVFRPRTTIISPWEGTNLLPTIGGQQFLLGFQSGITNPIPFNLYGQSDAADRIVPVYQYGDNITWLKGKHSFKGGFEVRFNSYAGYDTYVVISRATLGAGSVPVQNINPTTLPGLATNQALAQQLLVELNGSVANAFVTLNSPGGANPQYVPNQSRYRHLKEPEISSFFKDDWKILPSLTLNLGVRYEWYAVPKEVDGLGLAVAGGSGGIFGISGTGFDAMFKPGVLNGSLTNVVPIGPGTKNPGQGYYRSNPRNFAPAVGFSWAVPGNNWLSGHRSTVIRAGYSIGYERQPLYETLENVLGPGYSSTPVVSYSTLTNVGSISLPIPPSSAPLATVPLTDRATVFYAYDDKLRTPYYQNWNFSIQRSFGKNAVLELRYVGTKGVHLYNQSRLNIGARVDQTNFIPTYFTNPGNAVLAGLPRTLAQVRARILPGATAARPFDFLASQGFRSNIVGYAPQGYSSYNGLAVQVNRRMSNNFGYILAFTWSHLLDDATATNFSTYLTPRRAQDFQNLRADWSSSALDHRYRLTFTPTYDFKLAKGNWLVKNVVGNWRVNGTYTLEAPEFATVQSNVDSNLNNDSAGDRTIINPAGSATVGSGVTAYNAAGQVVAAGNTGIVAYVANNPNARYVVAQVGALANSGRNTLPLKRTNNIDMSLSKRFNFGEFRSIELSGQFFNVLNHAQYTGGYLSDVARNGYTNSRADLVPSNPNFTRFDLYYNSNSRSGQLVLKLHV